MADVREHTYIGLKTTDGYAVCESCGAVENSSLAAEHCRFPLIHIEGKSASMEVTPRVPLVRITSQVLCREDEAEEVKALIHQAFVEDFAQWREPRPGAGRD